MERETGRDAGARQLTRQPAGLRRVAAQPWRRCARRPRLIARERLRAAWQRGLTAIELIVTLAIAGLLLALSGPGFAGLRRSAEMSAVANELLWSLHLARSSAAARSVPATVCLTADRLGCVGAPESPAVGWLVFHGASSSATAQPPAAEAFLHSFHLPPEITVTATRPAVTFWPVARSGSTSTFDLCDATGRVPGRSIVVSQTGRPRVAEEPAQCPR